MKGIEKHAVKGNFFFFTKYRYDLKDTSEYIQIILVKIMFPNLLTYAT